MPYQIGWFSTGRDKAARDLLMTVQTASRRRELNAEIAFVFCNRDPGESMETNLFLRLVNACQIPFVSVSYQKFKAKLNTSRKTSGDSLPEWRLDYDRQVITALESFQPELCVLAGYMLIVGKEMCQKYDMINLHPAAPGGPAGTWQEVIWQLIERDARETGVMIHLVTPELDKGPPVTYCNFPIRGESFDALWQAISGKSIAQLKKEQGENNPLFKTIREHGLAREFPLILATIRAFSQGKVKITVDKKVLDFEGKPINGYNLTSDIDKQLKASRYRL
jgi:folate-dependent phosphoribosylglycinamide formyltransferase PurN